MPPPGASLGGPLAEVGPLAKPSSADSPATSPSSNSLVLAQPPGFEVDPLLSPLDEAQPLAPLLG